MASQTGTYITRLVSRAARGLESRLDISLETYGADVRLLHADFGGTIGIAQVEQELRSKKYKIVTITHVDTSTGANVPSVSYVRTPPNTNIIPFRCQPCFRTLSRWLMP